MESFSSEKTITMYKTHRLIQTYKHALFVLLCISASTRCLAEIKPHPTAIQSNNFANALVKLSSHLINKQSVISKQSIGGYGGVTNDLAFYKETKHINKANNQIISVIQWERKNPDKLHSVVVNIYDGQGRLIRDYSASYLPVHRRAPNHTLINLHYYQENLYSYRQFDALDNLLYEQCEGTHNNKPVAIAFEYTEIPDAPDDIKGKDLKQAYLACFKKAATAAPYTNPLVEIKTE